MVHNSISELADLLNSITSLARQQEHGSADRFAGTPNAGARAMSDQDSAVSTERRYTESELRGYVDAINRSQAVIEFTPDGTILTANENFLNAVGYTIDEIRGHHHRMFCEQEYVASAEYRRFWERLGKGQFDASEYNRIRKDGSAIWIQASYNPVFDDNGLVCKFVKYATDITAQKEMQFEQERSRKREADQQAALKKLLEDVASGADQIDLFV